MVLPWRFHSRIVPLKSSIESKSRFDEGSSNRIISGRSAATDAQAILCFCPPDRSKMLLPRSSSRSISATTSFNLALISLGSRPMFSGPNAISPSVSTEKNWLLGFWKTVPTVPASS